MTNIYIYIYIYIYWFYSRLPFAAAGNEWSFCHVHLCNGDWKRQNSCYKLPEYCHHVTDDVKQSNLNGANALECFHHMTKGSECKEHGIYSVEVTSSNKCSIVNYCFRQSPRGCPQAKCNSVDDDGYEIQNVPSVTEFKKESSYVTKKIKVKLKRLEKPEIFLECYL